MSGGLIIIIRRNFCSHMPTLRGLPSTLHLFPKLSGCHFLSARDSTAELVAQHETVVTAAIQRLTRAPVCLCTCPSSSSHHNTIGLSLDSWARVNTSAACAPSARDTSTMSGCDGTFLSVIKMCMSRFRHRTGRADYKTSPIPPPTVQQI